MAVIPSQSIPCSGTALLSHLGSLHSATVTSGLVGRLKNIDQGTGTGTVEYSTGTLVSAAPLVVLSSRGPLVSSQLRIPES